MKIRLFFFAFVHTQVAPLNDMQGLEYFCDKMTTLKVAPLFKMQGGK